MHPFRPHLIPSCRFSEIRIIYFGRHICIGILLVLGLKFLDASIPFPTRLLKFSTIKKLHGPLFDYHLCLYQTPNNSF